MILYNQNKLSLDDRIKDILPWFDSSSEVERANIRIRHMMSHASGITRDGEFGQWYKMNFPNEGEFIEEIQKDITFYSTNHQIKYSNFAFTILGLIIEKVSGKSYTDFIQHEIFDILEMKDSVTDVNQKNEANHCAGHSMKFPRDRRTIFKHVPARVMSPATGLSSNVKDLIKFYRAHFLGNDILLPDHIKREMQTVKSYSDDGLIKYGLGFRINEVSGYTMLGHGGGYPGFITYSGMIQSEKIIVVVLTNAIDSVPMMIAHAILGLIRKIESVKSIFDRSPGHVPNYSNIVGFYSSIWHVGLYSQIGSKLISISPGLDNPCDSFQILEEIEDLKFRIPTNFPFGSPGEKMKFENTDENNTYISMSGGINKKFSFEY